MSKNTDSSYDSSTDINSLPLRPKSKRKRKLRIYNDDSSSEDEFYQKDIFQETKEDKNDVYVYKKIRDISDSDISDKIPDEEKYQINIGRMKDNDLLRQERKKAKRDKKNVYKDPLLFKSKFHTKKQYKEKRNFKQMPKLINTRSIRKSTIQKSNLTKEISQKSHQTSLSFNKKITPRTKNTNPRNRYSQSYLINEAIKTEEKNAISLKVLLEREEKKKRKRVIKKKINGSYLRYHSKNGINKLIYIGTLSEVINSFPVEKQNEFYTKVSKCFISNQEAKYRDPETMKPYTDKNSFDIIRKMLEESKIRKFDRNKLFKKSYVITIKKPKNWCKRRHIDIYKYKRLCFNLDRECKNVISIIIECDKRIAGKNRGLLHDIGH